MFGTIRYVGGNKDGDFKECETGVVDGVSTNKPQHLACDNCRVKKVRDASTVIGRDWSAHWHLGRSDPLQWPTSRLFPMQNAPSFVHLFRPEAKEGGEETPFNSKQL
jgi:hypothetical protein